MVRNGFRNRPWRRSVLAALTLCLSGAAWALPVCGRTPQVRDAILIAVQAEARGLGSPSPYACEELTRLSLGRSIRTLCTGFSGSHPGPI